MLEQNSTENLHFQRSMRAAGRSRLLLLLLFPTNNEATDGCSKPDYWRCGDVCISADPWVTIQDCNCGQTTSNIDDGKWCCGSNCTGGECLRWEHGFKKPGAGGELLAAQVLWKGADSLDFCAEWSPINCTTGVALDLNQSCNGSCNFYGGDIHRNRWRSRSHVGVCVNTNICVKEGEGNALLGGLDYKPTICSGDSSCVGELDWCREESRKEEKCLGGDGSIPTKNHTPQKFVRCLRIGSNKVGGNGTKSIPGQCIEKSKLKDGEENDCLDRSDEDPFQEAGNETIIDFGNLKNCTDEHGQPGMECGGQESSNLFENNRCIRMDDFCRNERSVECPVLGEGIRTNDPTLCTNISFWGNLTCGKTLTDRIFAPWGEDKVRCQAGKSGQCVDKEYWGILGAKENYRGTEEELSCKDGSDLYRPIKRPTEAEEPNQQPSQALHKHCQTVNEQVRNHPRSHHHRFSLLIVLPYFLLFSLVLPYFILFSLVLPYFLLFSLVLPYFPHSPHLIFFVLRFATPSTTQLKNSSA